MRRAGEPVLHQQDRGRISVPWVLRGLRTDGRCPDLVAAGLALAGDEDGGGGAGAPARAVGEGVQDAGYNGVGREDPHEYDRYSSERHDESND